MSNDKDLQKEDTISEKDLLIQTLEQCIMLLESCSTGIDLIREKNPRAKLDEDDVATLHQVALKVGMAHQHVSDAQTDPKYDNIKKLFFDTLESVYYVIRVDETKKKPPVEAVVVVESPKPPTPAKKSTKNNKIK